MSLLSQQHLLELHPLVQLYKGGPLVPSKKPYTEAEVIPVCVYTANSNGWQGKPVVPQYGRDLAWSRVKPALNMLDGTLHGMQRAWVYLSKLKPLELYRQTTGGSELIDKKGGRAHANRVVDSLASHLKETINIVTDTREKKDNRRSNG